MDMSQIENVILRIQELLQEDRVEDAIALIEALRPADQADLFEELTLEQQHDLLPLLETEEAADILEELEDEDASEIAGQLSPSELATIVDRMEPDEAADLLGDLTPEMAAATLAQMDEGDEVESLLRYPDETAGGLMTSEFLVFDEDTSTAEALVGIRRWEPKGRRTPYVFVVDTRGRFVGVTDPFQVLRAAPNERIGTLVERDVPTVHALDDQEIAARLMVRYELDAIPVVDDHKRLLGVIDLDDAIHTIEEETTEDIFDRAALSALGSREKANSYVLVRGRLWETWRVRLPFLVVTLVGGIFSGLVIYSFEEALQAVAVLAVFIPMVMDMGGNAGTQSSTIFSRALVLGDIDLSRFSAHLLREMTVGLTMGLVLGFAAGLIATIWHGMPRLGLSVGLAMACTVTIATTLGFLIPFILYKLGLDQAAGSDPIITTIKDITGLLIYFASAYLFMGYML